MKIRKEVVSQVKSIAKDNPAANPVFHLLALRERTRSTLTLEALSQRMKQEGFTYTKEQYRDLLQSMVKAGIGSPLLNRRGTPVGIKDIKVNLSELGKAACDFKDAEVTHAHTQHRRRTTDTAARPVTKLEINIGGSPAIIEFPAGLSGSELAGLLEKLQNKDS